MLVKLSLIFVNWAWNLLILFVTSLGFFAEGLLKKTLPPTSTCTNRGNKFFTKSRETTREGNERTFHANIRSLCKNFDNLELF